MTTLHAGMLNIDFVQTRSRKKDCRQSAAKAMNDAQRERAIRQLSASMEAAYARWEDHELMEDYNLARTIMLRRDALVRERSVEQVRRLEIAGGLV